MGQDSIPAHDDGIPKIDVIIHAAGKPTANYAAVGAEARTPRRTTTYVETLPNQPFTIEVVISPEMRFESDLIAFDVYFNGVERDCRLAGSDECVDEPLQLLMSADRKDQPYCFARTKKRPSGELRIEVHHNVRGKKWIRGRNGEQIWYDNKFWDESHKPIWEFVFKYRSKAALKALMTRGLIVDTSYAPGQLEESEQPGLLPKKLKPGRIDYDEPLDTHVRSKGSRVEYWY